MYSKRGGRVQVNMMQYRELENRVDALEKAAKSKPVELKKKPETINKTDSGPTKPDVIKMLKDKNIKHDPRDKKDVLIELLNKSED